MWLVLTLEGPLVCLWEFFPLLEYKSLNKGLYSSTKRLVQLKKKYTQELLIRMQSLFQPIHSESILPWPWNHFKNEVGRLKIKEKLFLRSFVVIELH